MGHQRGREREREREKEREREREIETERERETETENPRVRFSHRDLNPLGEKFDVCAFLHIRPRFPR